MVGVSTLGATPQRPFEGSKRQIFINLFSAMIAKLMLRLATISALFSPCSMFVLQQFHLRSLPSSRCLAGQTTSEFQSLAIPWYAGYIPANTPPSGKGTMYFHYIMIQSERDLPNDPVVFWYNGGPGASSLFGMLQE